MHEVFVKNFMKQVSPFNTEFQDSFKHVCIIASSCVFIFKVLCTFLFLFYSLFNVSLLYLFVNHFTGYLPNTWWKMSHILTQSFNIQFNMYASSHHDAFLQLTFMYLSIPSSLLAEGTANTWSVLLYNDRKSRHRGIKKQRRCEHLCCNTSLVIPVGYGRTFKIYILETDSSFIKFNIKAK